MKKTGLVISLSLLFFAALAQEHQEQEVKEQSYNKLGFSALPFMTGTFQLQYEHWHASGNSLWLAPSVTYVDSDYEDKFGVGVEIQYRAYVYKKVTEKHIKNIFFAPYGFYKYFSLNEDNYYTCGYGIDDTPDLRENNINVFGGGMIFGMQYVFAEKVHLDFYAGGGLRKADKDNYYDYFLEPGYSGFAPKVGIDIGFSF